MRYHAASSSPSLDTVNPNEACGGVARFGDGQNKYGAHHGPGDDNLKVRDAYGYEREKMGYLSPWMVMEKVARFNGLDVVALAME